MVREFPSTPVRIPLAVLGTLGCLVVLGAFGTYVATDSLVALAIAFLVASLPIVAYVAVRWPLVLPFCVYVLAVPFDALSATGSGTITKLLGMASAAAIALHVLRPGHFVRPPAATYAWLALLGLMCASMLWSIEQANAMIYLQTYASLVALYALLSIVRPTLVELRAVLATALVSGTLAAAYATYLFRNGKSVVDAGAGTTRVIVSAAGASIDPNELSFTFLVPFAIALYWLFEARSLWLRLAMLPLLGVLLLGFAAAGSRGGFIALAVVLGYLLVRSRHRVWIAAVLVGSVIAPLVANPSLPARFARAAQDGGAGRGDIWRVGLRAFSHHWLVGVGVGNFTDAFDREYIRVYAHYVLGWGWVAHNVPLTVATELGIVGLAVYAVAVVLQLRALRGCPVGISERELGFALEAATLGIFVAGLSTSTLNAKFVWLAFALMSLLHGYRPPPAIARADESIDDAAAA